ncbi:MAG: hypothetical protein EOM59_01985 [Clostridia bacterium]|nr:hypothetical protein [Clostridia bacterium]
MPSITEKGKGLNAIISLSIPLLFVFVRPLGMTLSQSVILGWLFLTVIWWVTGWIYKDYASVLLLIIFIFCGNTPLKSIFVFPLSDNFILIIASFLLSQGIVKSNVATKLSGYFLSRYCDSGKKLVIMSFILGIVLIFVIPHPFPRIILSASIYLSFLNQSKVMDEEKKVLLFSIFVASTVTSMMFLNGDIIVNHAVMQFGGVVFTGAQWMKYMTIPTLITTIAVAVAFIFVFKNQLTGRFECSEKEELSFNKGGKMALVIMGLIIVLWLTEAYHEISSAHVSLLGVILMLAARVIGLKDVKSVNISLLIFLTAQFSIGNVLSMSGVAQKLSQTVMKFFPAEGSVFYIPFIILFIMVLHSLMGGLVTSVSILIPMLLTITAGILSPQLIVLLTLVSVCFHYLLPFQHATIMIGYGKGYYENRHTARFGIALTLITFVAATFIYLPWWKWAGLI